MPILASDVPPLYPTPQDHTSPKGLQLFVSGRLDPEIEIIRDETAADRCNWCGRALDRCIQLPSTLKPADAPKIKFALTCFAIAAICATVIGGATAGSMSSITKAFYFTSTSLCLIGAAMLYIITVIFFRFVYPHPTHMLLATN